MRQISAGRRFGSSELYSPCLCQLRAWHAQSEQQPDATGDAAYLLPGGLREDSLGHEAHPLNKEEADRRQPLVERTVACKV